MRGLCSMRVLRVAAVLVVGVVVAVCSLSVVGSNLLVCFATSSRSVRSISFSAQRGGKGGKGVLLPVQKNN
jgi:hypothetical protein